MFNTTFKKMLVLVTLAIVTMSISNAKLQSEAMWLEVNGVVGHYEVTGEYTNNGDGTVTLHPPWRIERTDGGGGAWDNEYPGTFKRHALAKIACFYGNEFKLQQLDSEPFNASIFDLDGKCIYSATDKTNITIDKSTISITNGTYMLQLEKDGITKFMKFMFMNDLFIMSEENKMINNYFYSY